MSVFGVFLVRIFRRSGWILRDTLNLSVFSPNAGKNTDQKNSECGHFLRSVTLFFCMTFLAENYNAFHINSLISYDFIWLLEWIILNHSKPKIHVIVNYYNLMHLHTRAQSFFTNLCQIDFMLINFNFWLNENNFSNKNYSFILQLNTVAK